MAITQTIATLPVVLNDSATFYEDIAERNNSLVTIVLPSINAWATQANLTQAEINAKAAQVAAQAVDGGYSQNYINTNFVGVRSTNITVNVGAGQTYATINQALEYLSGFYPMYKKIGITATINLKAGFVMAEQVLVSGIDLGWVTIVGEDAETIITHTDLTTSFSGEYPAFGIDKGGTSPVIGQLFRFNVEKVGGNKHGLLVWGAGSSANVLSGKGVVGAGSHGIYAGNGSIVDAQGANCSNAGSNGIVAVGASTVNANGANCSNAGVRGIYAADGSAVNARGANCSNAGTIGIHAIHGSTVNAIQAIIQDQTTGTARIEIYYGAHIAAYLIDTTGGSVPAFSQPVNTLTQHGIIYQ